MDLIALYHSTGDLSREIFILQEVYGTEQVFAALCDVNFVERIQNVLLCEGGFVGIDEIIGFEKYPIVDAVYICISMVMRDDVSDARNLRFGKPGVGEE